MQIEDCISTSNKVMEEVVAPHFEEAFLSFSV